MKTNNLLKRYYSGIATLFILCYAAYILLASQQDLLFAAQDMAVWRSDASFFSYYLQKPLGLLQYAALFLTQLFYFPMLGVALLLCLWALCTLITSSALSGGNRQNMLGKCAWSILPVLPVLVGITQVGYWIYYLKLPSYWLLPTLLWLWWAVALLLTFRCRNLLLKGVLGLAWVSMLTPWNGFSIYLFDESDSFFYITFYVAAALLLLQLLVRYLPEWLALAAAVPLLVGSSMLNYRNPSFHSELRLQQYAEQAQWDAVLAEVGSATRKPTRQMILLRDIALVYEGGLSDTLSYQCDGIRPEMTHGPKVHMAFTGAPIIFFSSGFINDAYRWTFENGVEYGFSPRRLRMMLRCALVNHEWELSRKYIRLLRMTLFHRSFADAMAPLVGHPELFSRHKELTDALKYKQQSNVLTSSNNYCERVLFTEPQSPLYNHRTWHFHDLSSFRPY